MKLSIHSIVRGKPTKGLDSEGIQRLYQDGKKVNLGYGWTNIEADWDTVFELITVDGVSTSAYLSSDNRKADTFVSRELFMVDIDSGMTIPELFNDELYNRYGAGFYVTPSHTDSDHRFRIVFRLDTPITDPKQCIKLFRALMLHYKNADISCKDATRIFYGTVNCVIKEYRDNTLPNDVIAELITALNKHDTEQMASVSRSNPANYAPLNNSAKQQILDLLKSTFVGNHNLWRSVGWGLKSGGFTLQDFQYVTAGLMNQKSAADAKKLWDDGKVDGDVTMGSVIYLIKQYHGADCLKQDFAQKVNSHLNTKEHKERLEKIERLKGELK